MLYFTVYIACLCNYFWQAILARFVILMICSISFFPFTGHIHFSLFSKEPRKAVLENDAFRLEISVSDKYRAVRFSIWWGIYETINASRDGPGSHWNCQLWWASRNLCVSRSSIPCLERNSLKQKRWELEDITFLSKNDNLVWPEALLSNLK